MQAIKRIISFAASCLLLLVVGCSCHTTPTVLTHGIPNLVCVDSINNVWRSGQPSDEGWYYLDYGLHVKFEVKFNPESVDKTTAYNHIMPFNNFITLEQQLGLAMIPEGSLERLVMALPQHDLLFHCEHGQDRTGLVMAIRRVLLQQWSVEDAEAEMLNLGFHKSLHGLWEYWEHFREQHKTASKTQVDSH